MDASTSDSLNKVLSNIENWIYVPSPVSCNVTNESASSSVSENKTKELVSTETFKIKLISTFNAQKFIGYSATVNRDGDSGIMNQAKYLSFNIYANAMEVKRGNANIKYAWYGGTRDELISIISNGFIYPSTMHGLEFGASLTPINRTPKNMAVADKNGFRHMLLCRVILGNSEVLAPSSVQYKPSSEKYDTGIDNLESPKNYVVWNANINTHILPEFIISFRARSDNRGFSGASKSGGKHMRNIMKELSRVLPADAIELISKHRLEYYNGTITPTKLVQRLSLITGRELLGKAVFVCLEKPGGHKGHDEQKDSKGKAVTACLEKPGHKGHKEQKDSQVVDELISQFSCQLKIKSTDKQ